MTSGQPLLNRARELAELHRAWSSPRAELIVALGRRRAGKSFLLTHYLRSHPGFYYQATRATAAEQLRAVSEAAAEHFGGAMLKYGGGFRNWDAFFRFIADQAGERPYLLVLDEVTYLLDSVRGFGTLLQKHWDHTLSGTQIKLVLSGSYISTIRRLTEADQPLHGRRTGRLHFTPFPYLDAAAFVPAYTATDRLLTYGIFGGLPGQLALIDPARSLAENVAAHVLNPGGRLADEALHLFDTFLRDAGVHYSIVRAIAGGEHRWSKITSRIGKHSASLSRPLEWLQEMEVVEKVIPVTETPPGNPKKMLYRLSDPYLAFWHRFVAKLQATGAVDILPPAELWEHHVAPGLDEYMGPVFEAVCRTFVGRSHHPALPFQPDRVGEWWSDDSEHQIDVVALGPGGQVLLGECKWGTFSPADLQQLERSRDRILRELRGITRVYLAAFSVRPLADRGVRQRVEAGELLFFTADELLL